MSRQFAFKFTLCCLMLVPTSVRAQAKSADQQQDEARRQKRDEDYRQAEQEVMRHGLEAVLARANEASTNLAKFQGDAAKFLKRLDDIIENDEGKKLARDDAAFLHYLELREHPIADLDQIKARKQAVDATAAKLQKQLDAAADFTPPITMKDEVEAALQWAMTGLGNVSEQQSWLDAVTTKATTSDELSKSPTLKQRIDSYNASKIEALAKSRLATDQVVQADQPERQRQIDEASRVSELIKSQGEAERMLQETRAQVARMQIAHDMEIKQLEDDQQTKLDDLNKQLAEAKIKRVQDDAATQVAVNKAEQDAEMIKKRQACHDQKVIGALAPFLGKGHWQPHSGKGIDFGPMSLSELRAVGALTPDKTGVTQLVRCANATNNDRPKWGNYHGVENMTGDQIEMVKAAQNNLIEFGDALVAEGLLAN